MKFGVIIVTYNRLKLLKECVEACLSQSCKFNSIIIINNCSTDGTYEYLSGIKDKSVTVINCDTNLGGAGGFHEGIKQAVKMNTFDYLLVIDDDAIIEKDFNKNIKRIIDKTHKNKEKIYAYSGTVMTDGQILDFTRKIVDNKYRFQKCDLNLYENEYFDYDCSSFCGLYISMDIIKKIGLPKKEFFIWYDDTEYSMRINKYTKIRNVNNAIVNHKAPLQEIEIITWKNYYGIRNKLYVESKYFPKQICIKHVIKNIYRSLKYRIISLLKRDSDKKFASQVYFWGTIDFMRNKYGFNEKFSFKKNK